MRFSPARPGVAEMGCKGARSAYRDFAHVSIHDVGTWFSGGTFLVLARSLSVHPHRRGVGARPSSGAEGRLVGDRPGNVALVRDEARYVYISVYRRDIRNGCYQGRKTPCEGRQKKADFRSSSVGGGSCDFLSRGAVCCETEGRMALACCGWSGSRSIRGLCGIIRSQSGFSDPMAVRSPEIGEIGAGDLETFR